MRAMILAAGLGERMQPLTLDKPKPLLNAGNKPLLQYHLEALARAGITEIVINHSRLGNMIETYFGDGRQHGVNICYSPEGEIPLDTGGGIKRALPLLGDDEFLVVNGDIWTDFDFSMLPGSVAALGHVILVDNPGHNPDGDFYLQAGMLRDDGNQRLTYSGIGLFRPGLFENQPGERFSLASVLRPAISGGQISGKHFRGKWIDVGTPGRLQDLDRFLSG